MIFQLIKIFKRPIEDIPEEYPYFVLGVLLLFGGILLAFYIEGLGEIVSVIGFLLIIFDVYNRDHDEKPKKSN